MNNNATNQGYGSHIYNTYNDWEPRPRFQASAAPATENVYTYTTRDFQQGLQDMQPAPVPTADLYIPNFVTAFSFDHPKFLPREHRECYNTAVQMEQQKGHLPSAGQFEELLNDYILSLSPKKRDKALIPQKRYDNILSVLKDPKCTTIESAQFRFWAKKMFRLGKQANIQVVMHEGKPVAVRESLYDVLTVAHMYANHGGRDKTSAQVRKNYSWVPKELIARFVRNCPSCTMRRTTHVSSDSARVCSASRQSTVPNSPNPLTKTTADNSYFGPPTPPHTAPSSVNRTPVTPPATYQQPILPQITPASEAYMARMNQQPAANQYRMADLRPAPPRMSQQLPQMVQPTTDPGNYSYNFPAQIPVQAPVFHMPMNY